MIRLFETALDRMSSDEHKIKIRADKTQARQHAKHYNSQTTIDEVAVVIVGENVDIP